MSIWQHYLFAHIKIAHQFFCAMLLGDSFMNHFVSNSLLLPHVAYTCTRKRTCIQNIWPPLLAGWSNMSLHHIRQIDRKVLGTAKLAEAKKVCSFGFLLFTGCQQWDDSVHTLILYVPSHVMVIQLSKSGSYYDLMQKSVSLYRKAVCVHVRMYVQGRTALYDIMLMIHLRTMQAVK